MAVGCGIQSAMVNTPCGTGQRRPCASSYTTPHAAAAAALVRQYFLDGWYPKAARSAPPDSIPPTGSLKAVLLQLDPGHDRHGRRRLSVERRRAGLIRLDRDPVLPRRPAPAQVWDQRHAAGLMPTVDFHPYDFDVADDTEQLKVTLVWSDPAPFFLAFFGAPVVNDLNLEVTAPHGTSTWATTSPTGSPRPTATPATP